MKTIEEKIKIMKRYANGGDVEMSFEQDNKFELDLNPIWDWSKFDYRIKEQKKIVTIEKWLIKTKNNTFFECATSDIDLYIACHFGIEKVKLLYTYEVEL